ncbi:hypothetical protein HDU81_009986 [Chytriomyces hyalinus]|nr:hypothetical protein HDU81_009986 [Chytriomyces hyalinus]
MTSRPTSSNRSISKSRLQSASTSGSIANSGFGSLPSVKDEKSTTSKTATRPPSAQPQAPIKPGTYGTSKPSTRPTSAVEELVPTSSSSKPTTASSKPHTRPATAVVEAVQSPSKRSSIANRTNLKSASRPATSVKFEVLSTFEAAEENPMEPDQPSQSTTATPKASASRNASRPETAREQLFEEPISAFSHSISRPETASKTDEQQSRAETARKQPDNELSSTSRSGSKSRPETASKMEEQQFSSTLSCSNSRPETASKMEGQQSRPETARKKVDQDRASTPSNSKSRPETASNKEEQQSSTTPSNSNSRAGTASKMEGQPSRPETAPKQLDQERASTPSNSKSRPGTSAKTEEQPSSTPSNSRSRPRTASNKDEQKFSATPSNIKSRPETASKSEQPSSSTPSVSKSRPETASKKEAQQSRPETARKQHDQKLTSKPSDSKSRPETASKKEEQPPSSTRGSRPATTKTSRSGSSLPASEQAGPPKSRPTTTPKSARPLTATSKSVVNEDALYPLNGRWAGWHCKDKPRKDAADECKAYNLSIMCQADGTAVCKSLVKEGSTVVKGNFKDTNIELNEPNRLHLPVQITASLHNGTEELVGNWKSVTDPSASGHLQLHRLSPATSNPGGLFISGQYFGTVFDESKDAWVFVEFPWLEAVDGFIYGKELVKGGVYKSVRGTHENSKIALYVTEWRGKKSVVTVFKGLISVVTGSIFGLRVSTLEFGFEDELLDLEDAWTSTLLDTTLRPDNTMSDESINFRLWRGAAAYPADRDFLRSFELRGNCLVKPGLWKGLWIVGNHTASDECEWTVAFSTSMHFSGYGTSTLEGIVERFVFDGEEPLPI